MSKKTFTPTEVHISDKGIMYRWKNRRMYVNKVKGDRLRIVFKSLVKIPFEKHEYFKQDHVNYLCRLGRISEYGIQYSFINIDKHQFECMCHSLSLLDNITIIKEDNIENRTI